MCYVTSVASVGNSKLAQNGVRYLYDIFFSEDVTKILVELMSLLRKFARQIIKAHVDLICGGLTGLTAELGCCILDRFSRGWAITGLFGFVVSGL